MATTVQCTLRKLSPQRQMPTLSSIENVITRIKCIAGYDTWSIGVLLVSDTTIRKYNTLYRHQKKSTDILSFANYNLSAPEAFPSELLSSSISSFTPSRTLSVDRKDNYTLSDATPISNFNHDNITISSPPTVLSSSSSSLIHHSNTPNDTLVVNPSSYPSFDRDLGDMIIAPDYIYRKYRTEPNYYSPAIELDAIWYRILVHGTVHLLGYNHEITAEAIVMEHKEKTILEELNKSSVKLVMPGEERGDPRRSDVDNQSF